MRKESVQIENNKKLDLLKMYCNALQIKHDAQEYGYISGIPYSLFNVYDVTPEQKNKINLFLDLLSEV